MEEDGWVVDCLIGYLHSPLWRNPVDDFIEQHCIVFDQPDGDDSSYSELHSDYQSMIEELLNGFIADVGISWDQLSVAITKSKNLRREHRMLLQPILASEQMDLFKKIMHQRNVMLERQALKMLQRELGQHPESYQDGGQHEQPLPANKLHAAREDEMLQKVLEMSKKDFETNKQKEDEEMERLVELAKQESLKSLSAEKDDGKLPTLVVKKSLLGSEESTPAGVRTSASIPLVTKVSGGLEAGDDGLSGADAAELWLQTASMEIQEPQSSTNTQVIPEDPIARKKYLSRQRDRLLESKRKARADELKNFKASAKPFGSKSTWKPANTTVGIPVQQSSYKKISDEELFREGDKQESTEKTGKQESAEKTGKGGLIKKTGVLCSAIAKKMVADGTDL